MISHTAKISLTIHKQDKEAVLNLLQETGVAEVEEWQIKDNQPTEEIDRESEYGLAQVKFALDFLNQYKGTEAKKESFLEKLAGSAMTLDTKKINQIVNEFDWKTKVSQIEELEANLNQAQNKINKLNEEEEILLAWQNLNFAPNKFNQVNQAQVYFGTLSNTCYEEFVKDLNKASKLIDIQEVNDLDKEKYLSIIFANQEEAKVKKVFTKYDFKNIELPRGDNLPSQNLKDITKEKKAAEDVIHKTEKQARKYLKDQKKLKIVFDWLTWQKERGDALRKSIATNQTFSLLLWVEEDKLESLEQEIGKLTTNFDLTRLKIKEDESVPVVIRNRNSVQPFESVTSIYGMPGAKELDPTPILAPFFIVFFALCLTDAGYGILLAAISIAMIKLMKVPRQQQGLFRLLIYGGIVTFFIGGLTGGWFGINLETLPAGLGAVKDFLLKIRIINPVKEPLTMLGVALALGIVQVMVGIAVNLVHQIKMKKYWDGILGSGLWLYFISTILFFILVSTQVVSANLAPLSKYLVLSGAVLLVLTQGRKNKNIFLKLASGVMSLYNLVGYLSDVLSYSRLLALGLATAIIAMVINLIAVLFKDMIPYVGWLVMIAILIGGHIFNLAINTLGAFIHSGRLQFVEFFPKFMEGGGRRFKPFRKETKYVKLV